MEANPIMGTDDKFAFWVSSLLEGPEGSLLMGVQLDERFGFGSNYVETYSGPAMLLSEEGTESANVEMEIRLTEGKGFTWMTKGLATRMKQFLITNEFNLRQVFSGPVKVSFATGAPPTRTGKKHFFPIKGNGWIGVLSLKRLFPFSGETCECLAYATDPHLAIQFPQEITYPRTGISLGKIENPV